MARPKKTNTKPQANEPEVLGPDAADPARVAINQEKKRKQKRDPFIDKAVDFLKDLEAASKGAPVEASIELVLKDAYSQDATPEAIVGFMKQIKKDGRIEIISDNGDTMLKRLPEEPVGEKDETAAINFNDTVAGTKTVAQHLAEAHGRPTRLQFPHTIGTWVNCAGVPVRIVNMQTQGEITMYDVKADGGKTTKDLPAWALEKLDPTIEAGIRAEESSKALRKHAEHGMKLVHERDHLAKQLLEQKEDVKTTTQHMKKLDERIAKHLGMIPTDGQQEIDLEADNGDDGDLQDAEPAAPPFGDSEQKEETALDRLAARIKSNDMIELDANQPMKALQAATIKANDSTGKPFKVKPIALDDFPGLWVITDMQPEALVLLQVLTREEWDAKYLQKFDAPRALPSDAQTINQSLGGPLTGCPVKVGRATLYLAPLDDALLIRRKAAAQA